MTIAVTKKYNLEQGDTSLLYMAKVFKDSESKLW
jgi:hypothetical protein